MDKLNQIFNLEIQEIKKEDITVLPSIESVDQKEDDFDKSRQTIKSLLFKNEDAINSLIELAKTSESPRAFEVAGQLIKAQAEIAKDLLSIHKQKQDISGQSSENNKPGIQTQNNIVFAGSTADLMKIIANQKK